LPQFDIVSNYYIIQIFSIFFLVFYIFFTIALNGIYKFINVIKINKRKNNILVDSKKMLKLMLKLKKFWYLKNFKK